MGSHEVHAEPPPDLRADTHPSREFQRRLLRDPADRGAWQGLQASYEEMSGTWRQWTEEQRGYDLAVRAGLRHTRTAPWALEICCGTGEATPALAENIPHVYACDLNMAMLRHCVPVPGVRWFVADVASFPLPDAQVPLIVSLNGVFNPSEIVRVIRPGGQLLWCTSFRSGTPLYVPPDQIHHLLGEQWTGEGEYAGYGEWTLFTAPG